MVFGWLLCLDTLLFIFTILPLRLLLTLCSKTLEFLHLKRPSRLTQLQKCDMFRAGVVVLTSVALQSIDASRIYHLVRITQSQLNIGYCNNHHHCYITITTTSYTNYY